MNKEEQKKIVEEEMREWLKHEYCYEHHDIEVKIFNKCLKKCIDRIKTGINGEFFKDIILGIVNDKMRKRFIQEYSEGLTYIDYYKDIVDCICKYLDDNNLL